MLRFALKDIASTLFESQNGAMFIEATLATRWILGILAIKYVGEKNAWRWSEREMHEDDAAWLCSKPASNFFPVLTRLMSEHQAVDFEWPSARQAYPHHCRCCALSSTNFLMFIRYLICHHDSLAPAFITRAPRRGGQGLHDLRGLCRSASGHHHQ